MSAKRTEIGFTAALLGILLASTGCSPGSSGRADAICSGRGLIDRFDADQVVGLLKGVDDTLDLNAADSGDGRLAFRAADGRAFVIEARQCVSERPDVTCEGLTLTGRIATPGKSGMDLLTYANDFNREQAAVSMFFEEDAIFLSDNIILDGGVCSAQLESSLSAFVAVLGQQQRFLLSDREVGG